MNRSLQHSAGVCTGPKRPTEDPVLRSTIRLDGWLTAEIAYHDIVRTSAIRASKISPEGTMSTRNLSKTERIDVRASTPVKQLLQEAARACHKNVSEFLLDAGVTAAAQTLADRRQFVLDEAQWQAFQEALDRPVQNKPRLKKLLNEPGVLG